METEDFGLTTLDSNVEESIKNQICCICGANHSTENCTIITIRNHILDKELPTKARLSLPDGLKIETLSDGTNQIRTEIQLIEGTRFGPLEAPKTFTLNPAIQFPIKIFPYHKQDFLAYYLDTADERNCTWMMFIEPADNLDEQNLICYQEECGIYFITTRNVDKNECLKVWYAPYYAEKMEKPVLEKEKPHNPEVYPVSDVRSSVKSHKTFRDRDSWTCKFCGSIKTDVTDFGNHIIEHYTIQLKKTCEICKATFSTRKSLHEHVDLVHNQHKIKKPAQVKSPEIPFNQNTLRELSIGGPLWNNLGLDDNLDNSNLLMPTLQYFDEDLQNLGTENLNVDNLLMENVGNLDHFDFGIGECQEEFVCDICVKSFSKLRYLIQHLRRHTGENMCTSCKKVFCRKESLVNHSCLKDIAYKCEQCERVFLQKKYYKRHITAVHEKTFKCHHCHINYSSKKQLDIHKCKNQTRERPKHYCNICRKSFLWNASLKKHISACHSSQKPPVFICEICAKEYLSKHAHDLHMKSHHEPSFQCEICDKKFHRKDVYASHLELHKNQELECNLCHKKFGAIKNLTLHQECHKEATFKCTICNAMFKSKIKLYKHKKIHEKSPLVNENYFSCPYCTKKVKLKSSLSRHIKRTHPSEKPEIITKKNIEANRKTQEKEVINTTSDNDNIMTSTVLDLIVNSKDNIDSLNEADMNELNNLQIEMIDNILLNTTKEMGIDDLLNFDSNEINNCDVNEAESNTLSTLENGDICLSMPDLTDQDLDITLGDKAYILENGTIVEPQENSDNIVVYVLNQQKN